jgi:hypothetical protein
MDVYGRFDVDFVSSDGSSLEVTSQAVFHPGSSLRIEGNGTFNFDVASMQVPDFEFLGGHFFAPESFSVSERFVWMFGIMDRPGNTYILPGALATMTPATELRRSLVNQTELTFEVWTVEMVLSNGVIENQGVFAVNGPSGDVGIRRGTGDAVFVNHGTILKAGNSGLILSDVNGGVELQNHGEIVVQGGVVEARGGCTGEGQLDIEPAGQFRAKSPCSVGGVTAGGKLLVSVQYPFHVSDVFQVTATGRLEAIDTTLVDSWVDVDGTAMLVGTLDLIKYNLFSQNPPSAGQVLPLINGGTILGRFAQVFRPTQLNGLMVCPRYQSRAVILPVRRNGDLNEDLIVNIDDLLIIVQGWGQCPPHPEVCEAAADCNLTVNVDDLLMVINNWD